MSIVQVRGGLEKVLARVLPPGTLPGDQLGWIYTPRILRDHVQRIAEVLKQTKSGVPLEQALMSFDGTKYSERVVEYTFTDHWLRENNDTQSVLDIGCVLNNKVMTSAVSESFDSIWYCNPAVEPLCDHGIETYYAVSTLDNAFRESELKFGTVTCLSTIEHIGYDNSQYGVHVPDALVEPSTEILSESLTKIAGLLYGGGRALVSVPYGRRNVCHHRITRKKAFQLFDFASIQEAFESVSSSCVTKLSVFKATSNGWEKQQTPEECTPLYGHGVPGAGAVALIELQKNADAE